MTDVICSTVLDFAIVPRWRKRLAGQDRPWPAADHGQPWPVKIGHGWPWLAKSRYGWPLLDATKRKYLAVAALRFVDILVNVYLY